MPGFSKVSQAFAKTTYPERTQSSTAHDSHANLSTLTRAEVITRAKNFTKWFHKPKKGQSDATYCIIEKNKIVEAPKNYSPTSLELGKLMDIALQNQWLTENSVLYALLTDTLTSLKRQEEEFLRHKNLTKR